MLTCRELAQLKASDYLEKRLTLRQWLDFRIHLFLCDACRRFLSQFRLMRQVIASQPPEPVDEAEVLAVAEHLHRQYHDHRH